MPCRPRSRSTIVSKGIQAAGHLLQQPTGLWQIGPPRRGCEELQPVRFDADRRSGAATTVPLHAAPSSRTRSVEHEQYLFRSSCRPALLPAEPGKSGFEGGVMRVSGSARMCFNQVCRWNFAGRTDKLLASNSNGSVGLKPHWVHPLIGILSFLLPPKRWPFSLFFPVFPRDQSRPTCA